MTSQPPLFDCPAADEPVWVTAEQVLARPVETVADPRGLLNEGAT
jgi:hypothetical protein